MWTQLLCSSLIPRSFRWKEPKNLGLGEWEQSSAVTVTSLPRQFLIKDFQPLQQNKKFSCLVRKMELGLAAETGLKSGCLLSLLKACFSLPQYRIHHAAPPLPPTKTLIDGLSIVREIQAHSTLQDQLDIMKHTGSHIWTKHLFIETKPKVNITNSRATNPHCFAKHGVLCSLVDSPTQLS